MIMDAHRDSRYTANDHIRDIQTEIARSISEKYEYGQTEHGGRLWRKPVLPDIKDEITDLVIYFDTHMQQFEEAMDILEGWLANNEDDMIEKAFNILNTGNPEGVME